MSQIYSKSVILENWPLLLLALMVAIFLHHRRSKSQSKSPTQKPSISTLDGSEYIGDFQPESDAKNALLSHLEDRPHVPFAGAQETLGDDGAERIYRILNDRRSVRNFSKRPVALDVLRKCILAAGTSPSGAHTEPWTFCVVGSDSIKSSIRDIIEAEELQNYNARMARQWCADLQPLRTNPVKQYLSDAPYLVLVFKQTYGRREDGQKQQHYYHEISTAIAVGLLLAALQCAGLNSLVTTPLNCGPALRTLLDRPANEKLMVLLPVGYAADDCKVPDIQRKRLEDIMVAY